MCMPSTGFHLCFHYTDVQHFNPTNGCKTVWQHDLEEVKSLCIQRMKAAREQHSRQEDMFTQLLAENLSGENIT